MNWALQLCKYVIQLTEKTVATGPNTSISQVSETQRQCANKRCNEVIEPVISQIPSGLCKKREI
jgi:hypothetical protein